LRGYRCFDFTFPNSTESSKIIRFALKKLTSTFYERSHGTQAGEKVLRQEVQVINEPLLQKVKLLDELDDLQRNSIYVLIDTAIANKRLKEALSNAMSI
jgi:hypothetical protein